MSTNSPKLERREKAIESTRRRLRRLEIEAHRIRADLARLEAEYEDDVADWLTRKLRRRAPLKPIARIDRSHSGDSSNGNGKAAGGASEFGSTPNVARANGALPQLAVKTDAAMLPRKGGRRRKSASPLLLSLVLHAAALLLCLSITFATLVQQPTTLLASPADLDENLTEEFSEFKIEPTNFEDAELQNVINESPNFNLSDTLMREFTPAELGVGAHDLGEIGQLDALPTDLGTLMAGAGSPGGGKSGGPLGDAVFFGTRSKGDRFVFVVDNSSSMKGGRLETATAELLKTIDSLSPRQTFYVIFVSDQTYPMFYPAPAAQLLPATAANKKRLADWLPNAILASGKNRELIKAMDMAAALRPHAVFLLWDGDLKYSEKVRLDVMTHLTRPNQWNFAIHTLGMGTSSLDAEYNLTAIAKSHGGTFRRIDVPRAQ